MDYQRLAIFFGLAVTSYLLVLAWNFFEDIKKKSPEPNCSFLGGFGSGVVKFQDLRLTPPNHKVL